jgi:hypothetical protein
LNAVEIEEAISALAEQPFDAQEFPFAFLEAFGNKPTTIKRLRSGNSNKSDLGGVLQTSNIHLTVCPPGEVTKTLAALKASPATARAKVKFTLATDGRDFEAEDLTTGETIACAYRTFQTNLVSSCRVLRQSELHHPRRSLQRDFELGIGMRRTCVRCDS